MRGLGVLHRLGGLTTFCGLRFGDDFDRVYNGVIRHRGEGKLDLSEGGRLDVVKCLYDRAGAAFGKDVEVLKQCVAVAVDVEDAAARTADGAVVFAKPGLPKVERDAILLAGVDGDGVTEAADAVGTVHAEAGGWAGAGELAAAATAEVTIGEPDLARGVRVGAGGGDDADRQQGVGRRGEDLHGVEQRNLAHVVDVDCAVVFLGDPGEDEGL